MSANFDKTVSIQFKTSLHAWIKQRAIRNHRSFNSEVRYLLNWLRQQIESKEIEL